MEQARVSLISVAYNSAGALRGLLASVPPGLGVIIVDNASSDDSAAVAEAAKAAGAPIAIKGFVRFAVGEGVEKRQDDFAAEVASMTKKD